MIKLSNVSKIYSKNEDQFYALKNINLELPDKGLIILKGKSGAGKTTLLNIIAKIDNPTEGSIETIPNYMSSSIVYQDAQLIDDISMYNNLRIVAHMNGYSDNDIISFLERFDLSELKSKKCNELSGGERQRVSIIRALLTHTPLLLCDEPTANLDLENAKQIVSVLMEISRDKLVVVSTHDTDLFEEKADGYIELSRGKIVEYNIPKISTMIETTQIYETKRIPFWSIFKLAFKGIGKTFPRFIILLITLTLSLSLMFFSFNYLFINQTNVKVSYNNNLEFVNFKKYYGDSTKYIDSMTEEDYDHLNLDYVKVIYTAGTLWMHDTYRIYDMIYYMDECPYNMIYGSSNVGEYEAIIPSYYANLILEKEHLKDYEKIIGTKIELFNDEIRISGVYDSSELEEGYLPLICKNGVGYPTFGSKDISYDIANLSNGEIKHTYFSDNKIDQPLQYGRYLEADDEICLPYSTAIRLVNGDSSKISSLLNQMQEFVFVKPTYYQLYEGYLTKWNVNDFKASSDKISFKIVGIYDDNNENVYLINENMLTYLLDNFFTSPFLSGFATQKQLSLGEFKELLNRYVDFTQYSSKISDTFEILQLMSIFTSVLGFILFAISIGVLVNYVSFSQCKKNKEIGILMSYGARKYQMMQYILMDLFILGFISVIFSNILVVFMNRFSNNYFVSRDIFKVEIIYYSGYTYLISFIFYLLLVGTFLLVVYLKNKKKTIYDLVTQR